MMAGIPPAAGWGDGNDSPCLSCACEDRALDVAAGGDGGQGGHDLIEYPNVPHHRYYELTGRRVRPKSMMYVFFIGLAAGAGGVTYYQTRRARRASAEQEESEEVSQASR